MRVIYSGKKATLHTSLGRIVPGVNEVPDNKEVRDLIAVGFFTEEPVAPITFIEDEKVLDSAENKMLTSDTVKTKSKKKKKKPFSFE